MSDIHDLELVIRSRVPLLVIQSHEELRVLDLLRGVAKTLYRPLFRWTVTDGLQRLDRDYSPQRHNTQPLDLLRHLKAVDEPGIYVLTDFHPYLSDPVHVRLLKDIALAHDKTSHTVVLLSHALEIPPELARFSATLHLALPNLDELSNMVRRVAREWAAENHGNNVRTDPRTLELLINNLSGLTLRDAQRLARGAIYDDGAITQCDLPQVMRAKYQLLSQEGVLSFEYETAQFSRVAGFKRLKRWLQLRAESFLRHKRTTRFDTPKGVMLLGVQGCGKSLAAKAIAGAWKVPLLRLDCGSLYNKYHGETERNLRESLRTAETMSPCVLWVDEIEKGIAADGNDNGTSKRVLGTLLTWMAERKSPVFLVATANDIEALPPELIRKGRFDEIFFVDLPTAEVRQAIFAIHLQFRDLDPCGFDLSRLAAAAEGFSGAEIEQAVVAALYSAHAAKTRLNTEDILREIRNTRPLSIVMAERIHALRQWASTRTVPCD